MHRVRHGLGSRECWQWKIFVIHVYGNEVSGVRLCGAYIATMRGGDEDRAAGVLSLTNKEPLVVVKVRIDIVWKVVREDCGDGHSSVVWKGKAPLRRGGCGSVLKRSFGAENGDVSCGRGSGGHRGSEVFASGGGDENVVGVNSNILVKWGKKERVKNLLGDLGGSGRHHW